MQGFTCAYCHHVLDQQQRGEVDHFRPKGGGGKVGGTNYWWLAYAFDNYFLSCAICNSPACKWDRFPLAPAASHADYATRTDLAGEQRLFVHPVDDPLDRWMRVAWKDSELDRCGDIVRCPDIVEGSDASRRIEASIELFRLNASIDLRRERIRALQRALMASKAGDRQAVHRATCRYLPHGAAAYCFLQEADPAWLPTGREELCVFLEYLRDRLAEATQSLLRFPDDKSNMKIAGEILWAFAVLWKDPPEDTFTSKEIAQWLDRELGPLKPQIEARLGRL
jgi:hypothetical protein